MLFVPIIKIHICRIALFVVAEINLFSLGWENLASNGDCSAHTQSYFQPKINKEFVPPEKKSF